MTMISHDIRRVAAFARERGITTIIDNTFATLPKSNSFRGPDSRNGLWNAAKPGNGRDWKNWPGKPICL